jgi:U3 small nucleolar RNA-associated protein 22
MTKGDDTLVVDMVVTMPTSILQEKDYLNYRYFHKRAYYIACIAAGIQAKGENHFHLSFENLNGNDLQPVLIVKPGKGMFIRLKPCLYTNLNLADETGFSKARCEVRIMVACPEKFFTTSKLQPSKNSIRPKTGEEGKTVVASPTPFYNATLRSDCTSSKYLKLLHQSSQNVEGFVDACILGRIWLRQRGFASSISHGGFGHFEWAALIALLLQGGGPKGRGVLSSSYSSYQLFKGAVQFLATSNLSKKPLLHQADGVVIPKTQYPTFYDGPRDLNILFKMSPWSYGMLQEEAKVSLSMLNDMAFDQFEATFITRKDHPLFQFDTIIELDGADSVRKLSSNDHREKAYMLSSKIYDVLKEGLIDRIRLLQIKAQTQSSWSLNNSPKKSLKIQAGFIFDPEHVNRAVDHGPAAEDAKSAAKFRQFWGEKAELRRFKDGSILESLVWQSTPTSTVFQEVVRYVLRRHLGVTKSSDLSFIGTGRFAELLASPKQDTGVFTALKESFQELEKNLRDMENLPLQLRHFSAISPQLRYSSINPPVFDPRNHLQHPADVLIQFEGSGRWPDDLESIQRTKIAFLLKIGELLEESSVSDISTRVGLENERQSLRNTAYLDIMVSSGATFRLRIHHDREEVLLERQVKDKLLDAHDREAAAYALSEYKRTYIQLPLHTQAIAIHCTRFPLLSPTIRLAKKWFSSHMLSDHFKEEFVELIVARTFLQPYPWQAPSSCMTGFLRTLQFISKWDWRTTPLIVDFAGSMTSKDISAINTRLEAWRKIDPAMNRTVLFAASNHDMTGTGFTNNFPSKVAAARMTALARSALKLIKSEQLSLDPKALFVPSTKEYDFVIHLSPKLARDGKSRKEAKAPKFKNLELQTQEDTLLIGYEPVAAYVDELKTTYGTTLVLFHDPEANSIIGGLWSPQTASKGFKVNTPYATKPVVGVEGQTEIDKTAILSEIARLGGDMVGRVEHRR